VVAHAVALGLLERDTSDQRVTPARWQHSGGVSAHARSMRVSVRVKGEHCGENGKNRRKEG